MRARLMIAGALALALAGGASAQRARQPVAKPAAAPDWAATVAITPQGGFRQGNPDAPVKLVEYGSRGCPTCGRFATEGVPALRRDFIASGKVSYEYRDYLIHGAPDLAMALLNQCVAPARFFPVLDAIYANQRQFEDRLEALLKSQPQQAEAWQKLPAPQMATRFAEALGLIAFMKTQGLPEARARQCLADPKLIERIAKTNADAVKVHQVRGTPTFIVNERKVSAFSWERLLPELWANGA
ncbi:MAG: thioredoxin domain-containing protein [Sphingomonas sp.]|uniref:thioredoxin domain-containing protein n=1 Tax=unclassified Sphingomonas TaxID=196159 RepID=UPI002457719D|nr:MULTISPECIES: thioredoxin domain-containing protein [unclassified Sphingomonas]MBQ1498127.1 thioredoxin domain-containing protein [Sphingomonas sp.]MDH4742702.1 DsbA family protein [Sphingomonas sp. CBMAI 2297]